MPAAPTATPRMPLVVRCPWKLAISSSLTLLIIAELKQPDLNATDLDGAMKMIAGTARSMGLEVVD